MIYATSAPRGLQEKGECKTKGYDRVMEDTQHDY